MCQGRDTCAAEVAVDVQLSASKHCNRLFCFVGVPQVTAYKQVCLERCACKKLGRCKKPLPLLVGLAAKNPAKQSGLSAQRGHMPAKTGALRSSRSSCLS